MTTTREVGLLGAGDLQHIAFAISQNRTIFTNDSDFLVLHDQGIKHSGIVYCHQQSRSVGEIIRALELFWEVLEPDEMRNHIEFI